MEQNTIPKAQRCISVLWPSFLVAGVATIVFFTAFDPAEIGACTGGGEISRLGAYTIGFFLFWTMTVTSSALTCYFRRPCTSISQPDR